MHIGGYMENERKTWLWIFLIVVLILIFGSIGMNRYGMMGFGFGFGWVSMILFWLLIAWLIVILVKAAQSERHEADKSDGEPLDILKKRYAKGEITKKQFDEMRKELLK